MRTFGEMALELIGMPVPVVEGVSTGRWEAFQYGKPAKKQASPPLGRTNGTAEREVSKDPADPFPGSGEGVRSVKMPGPVRDAGPGHDPVRYRERDPSSGRGIRLPPSTWHRAAAILGSQLTHSASTAVKHECTLTRGSRPLLRRYGSRHSVDLRECRSPKSRSHPRSAPTKSS